MSPSNATDFSLDADALSDVVRRTLDVARDAGATQAEASASLASGLTVTVRKGDVETLEYQRDRGFSITVYFGHRKGSASTADLSDGALADTVGKACTIARYTAEDEYAGLADPERMAVEPPDLDLAHPWDLAADDAIEIATACEAAGLETDPRLGNSEGATVNTHWRQRVYGNSHGFIGAYPATSHSVSCVLIAGDNGEMERDYWYSSARSPADLESPDAIGRTAAERTLRRLGAVKLDTRQAPVVFAADIARGLFGYFLSAIRGASQYRRSSFLLEASGQQVFPEFLRASERPHLPRGPASAPFDGEGVATADRELVEAGVLRGYLLSSYSARRLGLETTGNAGGVHNLLISHSERDLDGLLGMMGTGLYVTELMGQGVNGVTGDYSRGASGFWVENGKIAYPVHEITIAGNLRDMYRGIVEVAGDVDRRGGVQTGSVLIDRMTIAGN